MTYTMAGGFQMKDTDSVRLIMILSDFSTTTLEILNKLAEDGTYPGLHNYFNAQSLSARALSYLYETTRSKEGLALLQNAIAQILEQRKRGD